MIDARVRASKASSIASRFMSVTASSALIWSRCTRRKADMTRASSRPGRSCWKTRCSRAARRLSEPVAGFPTRYHTPCSARIALSSRSERRACRANSGLPRLWAYT